MFAGLLAIIFEQQHLADFLKHEADKPVLAGRPTLGCWLLMYDGAHTCALSPWTGRGGLPAT